MRDKIRDLIIIIIFGNPQTTRLQFITISLKSKL